MPVKLHELKDRIKKTTIAYDGEELEISFRAGIITPEYMSRLSDSTTDEDAAAQIVADLVISWDLIGPDGQPLPVTFEVARQCPLAFLQAITRGMGEAVQPGERNGATSGGGLRRTAK